VDINFTKIISGIISFGYFQKDVVALERTPWKVAGINVKLNFSYFK
jgi:hypothetical protein